MHRVMLYLCSAAGRTHLCLSPRTRSAAPAQTYGYRVRLGVSVEVIRRRPAPALCLHLPPARSTLPLAGVRRQSSVPRSAATVVRAVGSRWLVAVSAGLQYTQLQQLSVQVTVVVQAEGDRCVAQSDSVFRLSTINRLSAVLLGWTSPCPTRAIARANQQRRAQRCCHPA